MARCAANNQSNTFLRCGDNGFLLIVVFACIQYARVVRSFLFILLCVTTIFTTETIVSVIELPILIEVLLKLKWVGIILLPAVYLDFSDFIVNNDRQALQRAQALGCKVNLSIFYDANHISAIKRDCRPFH